MNEKVRNLLSRATQMWSGYSKVQRRNIAISVVAGIVCLIVILWLVMRPRYVTVMGGLDNKSLGQVDQELQTLKIPDKINGSSIEVPASDADKARVQLAMTGLPQSSYIGYSGIKSSLGMTQDQFNVQVLDALQQSLNQTIQSIDGIESAQVHIVMPDQALFVSQPQSDAKASVFVQVGQGTQLSAAQVAGIQQLVAHSVKGLSTKNVTVVDQNGVSLSESTDTAPGVAGVSSELGIRQKLEQTMQSQLAQGLTQIVGPGNSVVIVHANLSFDQTTSQSRTYQPSPGMTTGLPSSSQTDKKTSTSSSGSAVGGTPGQSSSNPNMPTYSGSGSSGGGSSSSETQASTTYDNSYQDVTTVGDPIQVKGYTVSVLLNAADKNLSSGVVNQIKGFLATSVGQSAGNGGSNDITVATVPFQKTLSIPTAAQRNNGLIWGAVGALVLLGGGVTVAQMRKRRRRAQLAAEVEPIVDIDPIVDRPMSEDERMKEELARLAARKPDEFVSLLRSWLAND